MQFYLGTHMPNWLGKLNVPLFVSDRRLRGYRRLPRANVSWALDSGGFTELSTHGSWDYGPTPREYARRVERYQDEVGHLDWVAPQDWMCEPWITAKTGLSVREHQLRTIENGITLRTLAPRAPWRWVVQGYSELDYIEHVNMHSAAGIDLTQEPLVGVGSVCRRQATDEVVGIFRALHKAGITRLHGFGLKKLGLAKSQHLLASADSMAWSFDARRSEPLPDCTTHINCANCPHYAFMWRAELLVGLVGSRA